MSEQVRSLGMQRLISVLELSVQTGNGGGELLALRLIGPDLSRHGLRLPLICGVHHPRLRHAISARIEPPPALLLRLIDMGQGVRTGTRALRYGRQLGQRKVRRVVKASYSRLPVARQSLTSCLDAFSPPRGGGTIVLVA